MGSRLYLGSLVFDLKRRSFQIGVRLDPGDAELLKRICKSRGEDVSDFVRRAVRIEMANLGFLDAVDRKALGVKSTRVKHQRPAKYPPSPQGGNVLGVTG